MCSVALALAPWYRPVCQCHPQQATPTARNNATTRINSQPHRCTAKLLLNLSTLVVLRGTLGMWYCYSLSNLSPASPVARYEWYPCLQQRELMENSGLWRHGDLDIKPRGVITSGIYIRTTIRHSRETGSSPHDAIPVKLKRCVCNDCTCHAREW